jgi:hypothetical protein
MSERIILIGAEDVRYAGSWKRRAEVYRAALEDIAAGICCGCCSDDVPQCDVGLAKVALRAANAELSGGEAVRSDDLLGEPTVHYAHKQDPNGVRFRQYAKDLLPQWAVEFISAVDKLVEAMPKGAGDGE